MLTTLTITPLDDADDTLRFNRQDLDTEAPADPDATSLYDLAPAPARYVGIERASRTRRRLIRATRQDIARLREDLSSGWDVGPELTHEERRLAALEAAERRSAL